MLSTSVASKVTVTGVFAVVDTAWLAATGGVLTGVTVKDTLAAVEDRVPLLAIYEKLSLPL